MTGPPQPSKKPYQRLTTKFYDTDSEVEIPQCSRVRSSNPQRIGQVQILTRGSSPVSSGKQINGPLTQLPISSLPSGRARWRVLVRSQLHLS
jgi:hypothetical protein